MCKRKVLSWVLTLAICLCVLPCGYNAAAKETAWVDAADTGWYNASASSYDISAAAQLAGLAKLVDEGIDFKGKTIILTADIDLVNKQWITIGTRSEPFEGKFDGDEHTITGLGIGLQTSPDSSTQYVGLFGYIGSNATVKNLCVYATIYSSYYGGSSNDAARIGGLAGKNCGLVTDCKITGTIISTGKYAKTGGITGINMGTLANSSFTAGTVSANGIVSHVGGITGYNASGNITNCFTADSVTGKSDAKTGGIVGYMDSGLIANCYTTADIASGYDAYSGGLTGFLYSGTVINCYAVGRVISGTGAYKDIAKAGGTAGYIKNGTMINCYWNSDKLAIGTGGGSGTCLNVTGISTEVMSGSEAQITYYVSSIQTATTGTISGAFLSALNKGRGAISGLPCGGSATLWIDGGKGCTPILARQALMLNCSADVGSATGSTRITAAVRSGNHLAYKIHNTCVDVPERGETLTGATEYTSGDNITGVSAGQYLALYEIGSDNSIAKFSQVHLTSDEIRSNAPGGMITESNTNITYDLSGVTLPDGITSLSVGTAEVSRSDSVFTLIASLIRNNCSSEVPGNLVIYNLKLLDQNENQVENFIGKIKVKVPIPSGMSGNLKVFWYNPADGTLTDMNVLQENGYLVFETTHFSYYAIAQLESMSSDSSSPVSNPKTGSDNWPLIPLAVLGGSAVTGAVIIKRRRFFRRKKQV